MKLNDIEQKIVNFLFCKNEKLTAYMIAKNVKTHERTCSNAIKKLSKARLVVSEYIKENFGKTVYGYNYERV
jgi:predicted transcriptional regulator